MFRSERRRVCEGEGAMAKVAEREGGELNNEGKHCKGGQRGRTRSKRMSSARASAQREARGLCNVASSERWSGQIPYRANASDRG